MTVRGGGAPEMAFWSDAGNLVAGDDFSSPDVFVYDRQTVQTTRVSVSPSGAQGNGNSLDPSLSADGRFVAFSSGATNLVAGDTSFGSEIFVYDRQTRQTSRVSVDPAGAEGDADSTDPSLSADGRFVAFSSHASNLVLGQNKGARIRSR